MQDENLVRLESLPWLPRPSSEFRKQCLAIAELDPEARGAELQRIASQCLSVNQMIRVSKSLKQVVERDADVSPLSRCRVGLVSNGTTEFIETSLEVSALRHGVALELACGDFDQAMQEALNPQSKINQARPDLVLVALDYRGVPFGGDPRSLRKWPSFGHQAAIDHVMQIRDGFRRACGAPCVFQTLAPPPGLLFGSLDTRTSGTLRGEVSKFNEVLKAELREGPDLLVDIEWLASAVGLQHWYDTRQWYWARLAFSQRMLPLYGDFVGRQLGAFRGKSKKCLVLDLDNTIWGGVIGDDGMDGLQLSEGDPSGESFRAVQKMALALNKRGIVLAVCSKNDERTALEPFQSHPDMILERDDISAFVANWDDKATNLVRIAEQLEIGVDSLVLLDDNPVERAFVRQHLPMVAVPELPPDPALYATTVLSAGYFEAITFTEDDSQRAEQYRANVARSKLKATVPDTDAFLRALDMTIRFGPFDKGGRKRIGQLINKTNQFNVTTRRYSEARIRELEEADEFFTLQIGLTDKFGDNGTISIVICERERNTWKLDTWLMSCRVLNRGVERAICNYLVQQAALHDVEFLEGTYIRTERNGIVAGLFDELGFEKLDFTDDDGVRWRLEVSTFSPFDAPLAVDAVAELG